jgi:hypothetical protein
VVLGRKQNSNIGARILFTSQTGVESSLLLFGTAFVLKATPHRSTVFQDLPLEKDLHEGAIHPVAVLFVLHSPMNTEFPIKQKLFSLCDFSLP